MRVPHNVTPLRITGPFSRLQKAQLQFQRALQQGTETQFRDAEHQLNQAQAQVNRIFQRRQRATFGGRLGQLFATTRINIGGGGVSVSPLAGRIGALFGGGGPGGGGGGGAAAGGVTAVIGVLHGLIAAMRHAIDSIINHLKTFAAALHGAALAVKELAEARIMTGGGPGGGVSFLKALGIQDITGTSAAVRQAISTGGTPQAQAAAMRLGVGIQLPRNLAPGVNEAEITKEIIQRIAALADVNQRHAEAVRLDQLALLPSIELYRRHKEAVEADAAAGQLIADIPFQQAASDLIFNLDRVKQSFMLIIQAIGKPFIKDAAAFLGRLANHLRDFALYLKANEPVFVALKDAMKTMMVAFLDFLIVLGYAVHRIGGFLFQFRATRQQGLIFGELGVGMVRTAGLLKDALLKPAQVQADAANTMQQAAGQFAYSVGVFGGGERTRRATGQRLPGLLEPGMFDRAVAGGAYRMGAF